MRKWGMSREIAKNRDKWRNVFSLKPSNVCKHGKTEGITLIMMMHKLYKIFNYYVAFTKACHLIDFRPSRSILVKNLPENFDKDEIEKIAAQFGTIKKCQQGYTQLFNEIFVM